MTALDRMITAGEGALDFVPLPRSHSPVLEADSRLAIPALERVLGSIPNDPETTPMEIATVARAGPVRGDVPRDMPLTVTKNAPAVAPVESPAHAVFPEASPSPAQIAPRFTDDPEQAHPPRTRENDDPEAGPASPQPDTPAFRIASKPAAPMPFELPSNDDRSEHVEAAPLIDLLRPATRPAVDMAPNGAPAPPAERTLRSLDTVDVDPIEREREVLLHPPTPTLAPITIDSGLEHKAPADPRITSAFETVERLATPDAASFSPRVVIERIEVDIVAPEPPGAVPAIRDAGSVAPTAASMSRIGPLRSGRQPLSRFSVGR